MRRAFTLIELLVIVAIIGSMIVAAVVSVEQGQRYARIRGSVRDIFATVRQARSIALVSQKPCIITFSTKRVDEEVQSKVEITSVKLLETKAGVRARSLQGQWRILGVDEDEDAPVSDNTKKSADVGENASGEVGHTAEEIMFEPMDEEVLSGICVKVVMDDEAEALEVNEEDEVKKSKISVFSNVDFLLGSFKNDRSKKAAEGEKDSGQSDQLMESESPNIEEVNEDKSVVWQVNGRSEPHTIYIYPDGAKLSDAWQIKVDRFGGVKVLDEAEE